MRSKNAASNAETQIEFTFALGDKIYRVYRKPKQEIPKKNGKGTTSITASAELFCNDILILFRDRAVTKKIEELLGFDAEQFRQVVLLPQGEFKKFLSADSDKRQEVLNVLFDSEPYKKIEEALSKRAKDSEEEKEKLQTEHDTLERQRQDAGAEDLSAVEAKLLAANDKVAELKKFSDAAQAQLTDGKLLAAKFADLQKKISELDVAKIQLAEADKNFSATQEEYQKRNAEESRRKELDKRAQELGTMKIALADLDKTNAALKISQEKLAAAKKRFADCDERAKKYAARLEELENQKARLAGADVELEQANQISTKAKQREKLLSEISGDEKSFEMERGKLSYVEEQFKAAQIELERLQIVNNAARLATKLKDGEPCPVCGSREHPAITEAAIPTAAELQAAGKKVDDLTKKKSQQEKSVAQLAGKLSANKNQLLADYAGTPDLETAQKILDAAQKKAGELAECRRNIDKGNVYIKNNSKDLESARQVQSDAEILTAQLSADIKNLKKNIDEIYLTTPARLNADLNSAQSELKKLNAAWELADKNFREADKQKSARAATLKSAQKNFDALQAELKDKTPPDIDSLEKVAAEAKINSDVAISEKARLENILNTLKNISDKLAAAREKLDAAEKIANMWKRLSDVANATGKGESELKISFQRYFLSTMFKDVVDEANNRLKKMSGGRYLFQMKDAGKTKAKTAGLNLEIFDEQTGAFRPVETLSGGESFLASLSLALGLASVVRNRVGGIKLDTIFIDEGFGSLDSETLDFAISTIKEQSGGRLVGIISHVEDLKNQMPVRLEVTKTKTGSSAKFIS